MQTSQFVFKQSAFLEMLSKITKQYFSLLANEEYKSQLEGKIKTNKILFFFSMCAVWFTECHDLRSYVKSKRLVDAFCLCILKN